VVADYIDNACRREREKERNDGSFIGKDEKSERTRERERKVAVYGKVKVLVDLIVKILHGG